MTTRVALAIGGVACALALAFQFTPRLARLDDSYIALHSARVVLSGHDPIYDVPALVGVTSPVYVALVAAILAPGIVAGDTALRLANAGGFVAYGAAVWLLGASFNLSSTKRVALMAGALASGMVILNLTNGLETGWTMAVLIFAIARAQAGRLVPVACAAGLLPFLRPDLAPASVAVFWYAARGRSRTEQMQAIAMAAAVAAPWLIWTRVNTGDWLAQTMRAKLLYYAEDCWPWSAKASRTLHHITGALVQLFPLSLGLPFLVRDRLGRAGLIAITISIGAYFLALPDALGHTLFRYFYAIVIPWLCLAAARELGRMTAGGAVAIAAGVTIIYAVSPYGFTVGYNPEDVKATAEWVDSHVPADAVLLVHDAGSISEYAHRRAVDLIGLKTPLSIAAHAQWTAPSCGAERATAVSAIAQRSGATHFVALETWDEQLHPGMEQHGFVLTPLRQPPADGRGYRVYRLDVAGAVRRLEW